MRKGSLSLKIEKVINHLTKGELSIANYLLDPTVTSSNIDVKSIIFKTNTGYSTLYNFLNKVGFKNIKELILALKDEEYERESIKSYINVEVDEQIDLSSSYVKVIKTNAENISIEAVDKFLEKIINAGHVYFVGLGESYLICNEISYRLTRFGISCSVVENESGTLITKVMTLKSDDLLVCVSFSGESKIIVEAAKIAKQNNVNCSAITTSSESSLSNICNDNITIYFPIRKSVKEYYVSSLLPALYFVDLLSRRLLSINGSKYEEFRDKTSEIITKVVKIKD